MLKLTQRQFNRLAVGGLVIGFLLLAGALIAATRLSDTAREAGDRVEHTFQVISQVSELETFIERTETSARGYLLAPDPVRASNFKASSERIMPLLRSVKALTTDSTRQQAAARKLEPMIAEEQRSLASIMDIATSGRLDEARREFQAFAAKYQVIEIRKQTDLMRAEERRLLGLRSGAETRSVRLLSQGLAATGILLMLIGAAAALIVRRYVLDLRETGTQLQRLNTDLEGAVQERTADLTRANEEIQRFAYIVSHDLRSPLVNIMGFTAELEGANKAIGQMVANVGEIHPDLVSQDARYAAEEDLPEAIGFIRSATQKMDRLINAILGLSREGRRVLSPELLPMDMIVGDVIANLSTIAEERDAKVRVETPLPNIVHDRLVIEQIFQNIIENAIKYLRPGVPGDIRVSGQASGGRAIFDIADNGRGISPEDHRRIFELFRRAGVQDQRGEGIGLASVNALVLRLGGTISVRSTPGEGSTFTVNLPIEYREKGDRK